MYTRRVRTEYADWEIAGRYRLEEPIGKGGMGSVWRARHLSLDAPVAVKLIDPALARDDEARTRFLREARAAAALRSPNVVQTFDFGVEDGVPFIVMELLQGETLEDRLARSAPLSPEETVDIMVQVSRAIAKAHEHGIIHRDLKPDNIFLTEHDDEWVVKVLDFGVAKFTGGDMPAGAATRPGAVLGTPFYMSPEQAEGKRPLDWRADLWSLAVLTFECVVGVRPFQGDTAAILFVQLVAAPIPVPSQYAKVPPGFDEWWARAAQRDPELRFQSSKEQAESLCAALGVQRRTSLFSVTGEHPIVFEAVEAKVRARRAAAAANGPPSAPRPSTPAHDVPNEDSGVQPQSFRGADDSGAYLAASGVIDKPMVWIPPIELIGDSPDMRALADGLAEDIRVGIGLHRSLRVTDSSTRGPAHAHFIAKSALQGHGSRLRLSVRLEDGATKEQFWSQRYERDGGDPFEVQDALTRLVVSGLWTALRVRLAEKLRFIDNSQLSVPQLLDKAAGLFARSVGEGDIAEDALRRVIAIEPENAMALGMLGYALYRASDLSPVRPSEALKREMWTLASRAVELDGKAAAHLVTKAMIQHEYLYEPSGTLVLAQAAHELNPVFPPCYGMVGITLIHSGRIDEGLPKLEEAIARKLNDANQARHQREHAIAHFLQGDVDKAIEVAQEMVTAFPSVLRNRLTLVALLGLRGLLIPARSHLQRLKDAAPELCLQNAYLPALPEAQKQRLRTGLSAAGLT